MYDIWSSPYIVIALVSFVIGLLVGGLSVLITYIINKIKSK